jgi:hypothetical protein
MNRRTVLTGAAALAASAVVPVSIVRAVHPGDLPSIAAAEFAAIVMAMPAEKKALFAAMLRNNTTGPLRNELADVIEQLAVQDGWVRGEQHAALLAAVSP